MEFTSPRATFEETMEFANAVRKAGGGAVLDALMPATPDDPERCLIAKNLNFNCRVDANGFDDKWHMGLDEDEALRDRIADALGLAKDEDRDQSGVVYEYYVVLPQEIGQVAADFDEAGKLLTQLIDQSEYGLAPTELAPDEIELVQSMAPYIEASLEEVKRLGIFNERGELVL